MEYDVMSFDKLGIDYSTLVNETCFTIVLRLFCYDLANYRITANLTITFYIID